MSSGTSLVAAPTRQPSPYEWLVPVLRSLLPADVAAEISSRSPGTLWDAVSACTALRDHDVLAAAAAHLRLPVATFDDVGWPAPQLVSERWARKFHIVPLWANEREIGIATSDPFDMDCERTLAFATSRTVRMALATPHEIARRINQLYGGGASPDSPERTMDVQLLAADHDVAPPTAADHNAASVVRMVDDLLGQAITARASDIHMEPEERGIAVRHRVDGVMHLVTYLPRDVGPALVSRVKIMSRLNIADRLRPQDGHARIAVNGVAVDLRISTLPASHGEKVVVRVLDKRSTVLSLEGMGFHADELARLGRLLQVREGLILVTGPTGSGKTTTLYAALRRIKDRGVNIITVEDPIEYRLPGVVQVQVHERAGLTFAAALRSIVRQDPDVLLIGEIRDRETADIAIQASLTGHLVLSTLHTNDAASAVARLADIGVPRFKIASAVKGIVAQRLVRRLCEQCRCEEVLEAASQGSPSVYSRTGAPLGQVRVFSARGCQACNGVGYRGRLAILEVLGGSPDFERVVASGESTERIAEVGRLSGGTRDAPLPVGRSLWGSGLEHVRRAETSLEELLRVAAPPADAPLAPLIAPLEPARPLAVAETPLSGEAFLLRPELERDVAPATGVDGNTKTDYLTFRPRQRVADASPQRAEIALAQISIGSVDVYLIRPLPNGWRVLTLQRAPGTRCPLAWETVHGHIEAGEEPENAALREVREETGLDAARLYSVTVQPFYLHASHAIHMAVVFAAFVDEPATVTLGSEHQKSEWLSVEQALTRFQWPREREAIQHIVQLLGSGDAGAAEDVLRVK